MGTNRLGINKKNLDNTNITQKLEFLHLFNKGKVPRECFSNDISRGGLGGGARRSAGRGCAVNKSTLGTSDPLNKYPLVCEISSAFDFAKMCVTVAKIKLKSNLYSYM